MGRNIGAKSESKRSRKGAGPVMFFSGSSGVRILYPVTIVSPLIRVGRGAV
jgi:hypothetical protein